MDYPAFAERNMKNFEEVYFDEQPGRIILFPGWLKHYTEANQSDQDRVILSFNLSMFPTAAPGAIVRPPHVTTR
jgi:ectoine hydroxylase-related dioxygenase (phytanoyl-CoA dioxygenase family)